MNSLDLITVLLHNDSEINGLWRIVLVQRHFWDWYLQFFKIHEGILIKSLKLNHNFVNNVSHKSKAMIVCKFFTWPLTAFVDVAEATLAWSQWKFMEMWVRYGVNLIFSKIYQWMNHLPTKGKSKMSENLSLTLYT